MIESQGIDPAMITPAGLEDWRRTFDEVTKASAANPKVGLMKLRRGPGEHLYSVAVRDGSGLWLTLWVRRSRKGDVFVMVPRADRGWDPHTSYHADGTFHSKSFHHTLGQRMQRQPLTTAFRGNEHLGGFYGHSPKTVAAVCDPTVFSGVIEVPPGVLGPFDGKVTVDLAEPGCQPIDAVWAKIVRRQTFIDVVPWLVITVGR